MFSRFVHGSLPASVLFGAYSASGLLGKGPLPVGDLSLLHGFPQASLRHLSLPLGLGPPLLGDGALMLGLDPHLLGKRHGVPVYAVLSASRLVSPSKPESPGNINAWRGEALRAWQAGVNGIYTFNRFNPKDPIFRELGDPKLLETKKRTYKFNPGKAMDYWLKNGKRFLKPEK